MTSGSHLMAVVLAKQQVCMRYACGMYAVCIFGLYGVHVCGYELHLHGYAYMVSIYMRGIWYMHVRYMYVRMYGYVCVCICIYVHVYVWDVYTVRIHRMYTQKAAGVGMGCIYRCRYGMYIQYVYTECIHRKLQV